MNQTDVTNIEAELGLRLPHDYRHLLLHFPIRFEQGTSDGVLWDDAAALIARNRELRSSRRSLGVDYAPLPERYLFIGDDGAGWQHLIDLETDPSIVHVMQFEDVSTISPAVDESGQPQNINDWFHAILIDLKNDGVDITAEEPPDDGSGWGCILIAVAAVFAAAFVFALVQTIFEWLFDG